MINKLVRFILCIAFLFYAGCATTPELATLKIEEPTAEEKATFKRVIVPYVEATFRNDYDTVWTMASQALTSLGFADKRDFVDTMESGAHIDIVELALLNTYLNRVDYLLGDSVYLAINRYFIASRRESEIEHCYRLEWILFKIEGERIVGIEKMDDREEHCLEPIKIQDA